MNPRTFICETDNQRAMLAAFITRQAVPFQAEVGPVREHRSLSQNARLWKLHTLASEVTGYTPDELHEICLCKHYGFTEVVRPNLLNTGINDIRCVPLKRSSTRDKKEFTAFMEFVEMWYGSEFGVWLDAEAA